MIFRISRITLSLLVLASSFPLLAQNEVDNDGSKDSHHLYNIQKPRPLAADPRFKTYVYRPNGVYQYIGYFGYQSRIEFAPDEKVETIAVGDPNGWQISQSDNRLFLKPIDRRAFTTATILTDKREYTFEFDASDATGPRDPNISFSIRFIYPDEGDNAGSIRHYHQRAEMPDLIRDKDKLNFNYSVSGSDLIAPIRIFDDGDFTFFQFDSAVKTLPAIFEVDSLGEEGLVNFRVVGDYMVVETVTSQYTLRNGPETACVFNESRPLPKYKGPKRKFFGLW